MNSPLDSMFDLDDDDLRMRFDAIAARATMPVVDPMADLRRGRDARRRRRVTQVGAGLVAAAAVSALVIGNLAQSDPDTGGQIANQPTSNPSAIETPNPDLPENSPETGAFARNVDAVMGSAGLEATMTSGTAAFDSGAVSVITGTYALSDQVSLDVRAGKSREALEWKFAENTRSYPVGDAVGERGTFGGVRDAYIFNQPDGDVVLVVVDGPKGQGPTTEQINALLVGVDVPDSRRLR